MKNFNTLLKKGLIAMIILCGVTSCADEELEICNNVNTPFQQLFNATLGASSEIEDKVTMDLEVHSYIFKVNTNKTICQIGYQGASTRPYTIRLKNFNTHEVVYTGTHVFSSTSPSYINTGDINLVAGVEYLIERELEYETSLSEVIGRIAYAPYGVDMSFPISNGNMIIVSSSFYGMGGPINDKHLPFIDVVFKN